eukprot:6930405-Prymnesium_polylepis.1
MRPHLIRELEDSIGEALRNQVDNPGNVQTRRASCRRDAPGGPQAGGASPSSVTAILSGNLPDMTACKTDSGADGGSLPPPFARRRSSYSGIASQSPRDTTVTEKTRDREGSLLNKLDDFEAMLNSHRTVNHGAAGVTQDKKRGSDSGPGGSSATLPPVRRRSMQGNVTQVGVGHGGATRQGIIHGSPALEHCAVEWRCGGRTPLAHSARLLSHLHEARPGPRPVALGESPSCLDCLCVCVLCLPTSVTWSVRACESGGRWSKVRGYRCACAGTPPGAGAGGSLWLRHGRVAARWPRCGLRARVAAGDRDRTGLQSCIGTVARRPLLRPLAHASLPASLSPRARGADVVAVGQRVRLDPTRSAPTCCVPSVNGKRTKTKKLETHGKMASVRCRWTRCCCVLRYGLVA